MELGQQDETLEESTSREVQLSLKTPISPRHDHDGSSYTNGKVVVIRYKECQKNHAAAIGGNATDGCGEFMPAGEEGSIDALVCSACSCHRNFHRKEIEHCIASHGDNVVGNNGMGVEYVVGQSNPNQSRSPVANNSENNNEHQHKKRFRTKFTAEQKERMVAFAEKAGWKIQKLDESVVQQFCREIGIKRRVLKVWMHNNKYSFAKKSSSSVAS